MKDKQSAKRRDAASTLQSCTTCPVEITVEDASRRIAADPERVMLIDVREADEIAIARIEGATHIPMRQIPENLATLKDAAVRDGKHLLILCHHGGRSLRVTEYLRAHGIASVSNIADGIDAWSQRVDVTIARYGSP